MSARTLYNEENSVDLLNLSKYWTIDSNTRKITPPTGFVNFGVESDEDSNRAYFECPKVVGDNIDLAKLNLYINFQNAKGEKDKYAVTDVVADGDLIHFSWKLSRKAMKYSGNLVFIVCALKTDTSGTITNEWNTTTASGLVLSGLEVDAPTVPADASDLVNQLLDIVNNAIADMETAAADSVANVQTAEAEAMANIGNGVENALLSKRYANGLIGKLSGAVVTADDVSPIPHELAVKVRSKNIFDNELNFTKENSTTYTFEDGTLTVNGYYVNKRLSVESGKTYTFSFNSERTGETGGGSYIIARSADGLRSQALYAGSNNMNLKFTFKVPDFASFLIVFFYGGASTEEAGTAVYTNIQIVEGETQTEYTPYIAPESITVIRCGKNILGFLDSFEITQTGLVISYDAETQVFTMNGTPTQASFSINFGSHLFEQFAIPIGENVSLTVEHIGGTLSTESATNVFYLGNSDTPGGGRNNWFSVPLPTSGRKTNVSMATRKYFSKTWIYIGGEYNVTFTDYKFKVQLELGTEATEHENFSGIRYTPEENGNIPSMISNLPNMSILSDTNGVTIECEYVKDTEKAFQSLIDTIAVLAERVRVLEGV